MSRRSTTDNGHDEEGGPAAALFALSEMMFLSLLVQQQFRLGAAFRVSADQDEVGVGKDAEAAFFSGNFQLRAQVGRAEI